MHLKRYLLPSGIVLTLVLAVLAHRDRSITHAQNQLLQFRSSLAIGLKQSEIQSRLSAGDYDQLELVQGSARYWLVTTPLQLGATNWILRLKFADGSLAAYGVRTADTPGVRPDDAPADVGPMNFVQ